nr:xanthine dehydrogenase family protein subunit M [Chloroflexota bacterium]
VVVGAADEMPRVVPTAQFSGADAGDAGTREALAEAARAAVEPIADLAGGVEYKRHLVGVFALRAIDSLVTQAA